MQKQISENQRRSQRFHLLKNSHKLCRGFQQAMEARTTCFITFIKLLFSVLTKRKMLYEGRIVYLNFCHENVTSHNLETEATILLASFSCFIALWKHTCSPIKMYVLAKSITSISLIFDIWNIKKIVAPTIVCKADVPFNKAVNFHPNGQNKTADYSTNNNVSWTMDTKVKTTKHNRYWPCIGIE